MQIDLDTVRWLLSGLFFTGGGLVSWLLTRQMGRMDKDLGGHDERISANHARISEFQIEVAKTYVSKLELKDQLETQIAPLRDDMRDIKTDIKTLLKKP